jgi:hypothetical protein
MNLETFRTAGLCQDVLQTGATKLVAISSCPQDVIQTEATKPCHCAVHRRTGVPATRSVRVVGWQGAACVSPVRSRGARTAR